MEEALFGVTLLGHVKQRADAPQHLAVRAKHRARAQMEPTVVAVLRSQSEILSDAAATAFDGGVERRLEAIAVARMKNLEPVARVAFQRSGPQTQNALRLRSGEDAVAADIPVPHDIAGPDQGQRSSLGIEKAAFVHSNAAGEGMLHHGEADQQYDQNQTAVERRLDDVIGELPGNRQPGG